LFFSSLKFFCLVYAIHRKKLQATGKYASWIHISPNARCRTGFRPRRFACWMPNGKLRDGYRIEVHL
jgi:hypothetical protein